MFFNNIQAMRGIASLIVFMVHLFSTKPEMVPGWVNHWAYVFGPAGVDIFFVISGFVVTLAAEKASRESDSGKSAITFLTKRALRIYPAYWVVFAVATLAIPYVWLSPDWLPKASNFLLATLTYPYNYKVMVAWTLVYEMFFYLVLACLILFKNRFWHAVFIWIFVEIMAISFFNSYTKGYADYVPLNFQILQFSAGCVLAFIHAKYNARFGREFLALGTLLFIVMCIVNTRMGEWSSWNRTLTLTLPAAMLVYGAFTSERENKFRFTKPLIYLGNISFSLYLWHQLTFQSMLAIFENNGLLERLPHAVSLLIWAFMGIFVACASYNLIEKPSLRYVKRNISKKPQENNVATESRG